MHERIPKTKDEELELRRKSTSEERRNEIKQEAQRRYQSNCRVSGCDNDAVSFPSSGEADSRGYCTSHSDSQHGKASPGRE